MKLLLAGLILVLVVGTEAEWYNFPGEAFQGAKDMWNAYTDMREANFQNSDKYFHARGNRDAAQRGPGGRWASEVISNAREWTDRVRGGTAAQSLADQEANAYGRNGGDLNRYRPAALPEEY
ncbi:serum amyloid A-5 protein-like [Genypterus blacodes]|uniref:serum amyloid A-5 protein-like n=1 Tax=Genypterus blacodes TaxID=154954 RepID=UPI003F7581A7